MLPRGETIRTKAIRDSMHRASRPALSFQARWLLVACLVLSRAHPCHAQLGLAPAQTQAAGAGGTVPVDVVGVVVDARNRSPIPRALVRAGNRAVLTDHDGVFTFPQFTYAAVSFMATKPGFYATADGDGAQPRLYHLPLTAPLEIPLYPEAILSGSVINQAGEGLSGLSVTANRSVFDETGHHWYSTGQAQTSSAGDFRIPVPPGRYMLRVNQRGRADGGREVVLPLQVPSITSSDTEAIKLQPGEESRTELRAEVRRAYTVSLHLDTDNRGFPSLVAKTANGGLIPLSAIPSRDQGDLRVSLPAGSYTIVGSMQNQEGLAEGQTQVTVTDHDVNGIVLHLSRAATLPVVVEADSSARLDSTTKLPDANQLGLTLQSASDGLDGNANAVRVTARRNAPSAFSLADGVYRLRGQAGGQWYISTATCGGIDLLSRDIPVSSGLDGTEVRVRVSNNTATLSGKVAIAGAPGAAWIYLVATGPSATPVLLLRSNTDGSFFRPYLAPGAYRVIALEQKVNADLQDNATLSRYLDRVQAISVAPGEQRTITLDAVAERESAP